MTLATEVRNRIKAISTRKDVRVEYRKLGRAIKKQWLLEYARDTYRLPPEIIEFYAEFDGFDFAWRSNGLVDDPRDRARGLLRLQKLNDVRWSEAEGYEVMRLDDGYGHGGLMLIRRDGEIRAGYAPKTIKSLDDVRWFASFREMFEVLCYRGFVPLGIEDDALIEAVHKALAGPKPKKVKLEVGTRVYGEKIKTEGFDLSRRGTIAAIVDGNNGRKYARINWDKGDTSYTRVNFLQAIAEDAYERVRQQDLREVSPEVLGPLLDGFGHNVSSCLYIDGEPDKTVRFSCESMYWLVDLSRSTPLEGYLQWVSRKLDGWKKLPSQERVDYEEAEGIYDMSANIDTPITGGFGGSSLGMFRSGLDIRRLARAMIESVALRWLRAPQELDYAQVIQLFDRIGWEREKDNFASYIRTIDPKSPPELRPLPKFEDENKRAQSLGLDAPVYYCHD